MAIDFVIDPMSEDFRSNSADYYRRLVREQPVAQTVHGQWLLCRHADVRTVLTDRKRVQRPSDWSINRKPEGPLRDFGRNNMVGMNPPDHTRFRQAAAAAFSPASIRARTDRIAMLADGLIERMLARDEGDFIRDFAAPLPIYVICDLLGVSPEDHDLFGSCTADMLASLEMAATPEVFDRGTRAARILFDYCCEVARQRESEPRADLISMLISRESDGRMSREELIWVAVTMLIAGHETTTHMLGNGMLALLHHPEQYEALEADPSLAPNAVEEILRYDPTLYVLFRQAIADIDFGDQRIPAGSFLLASLYGGNHDPEVFTEPDRFDIRRTNADQHLTFAAGQHLCLGHTLARLEGAIAFPRLLSRFRQFSLAAEPTPRNGLMFKGYLSIPMTWRAA